jgi:hypothetical protein
VNRETFVTLYKNQLFTASQVVDIVQIEREKVLDELDKRCELAAKGWCENDSNRDPFNSVREWIKELRQKAGE